MNCFQDLLGLKGDILTDTLHPLPRSRRRSKLSDEAEAAPLRSALRSCTDLYLVPVAGEDSEAGYEDEDPLLECDIIVKEETESD